MNTASVVDAALAIVDELGIDGLTLALVARRTAVATPSLYKHIGSLAELRTLIAVRVLDQLTERLTGVVIGRSGDDAVAELMRAMRGYVTEHPARYAAIPADPLHDPSLVDAGRRLMDVFLAVLRGYRLEGSAATHATRRLRVIVHGFVSIESAGGFGLPEDLEDTYEQLIAMYIASLPRI